MKKFIQTCIIFISVPLSLMLLLEVGIYLINESIFTENKLDNLFSNEIANYEWIKTLESDSIIVLAGSSSVRYGLSCSRLNELNPNDVKYVNIAMDARDPITTYFIIKNLPTKKVNSIYFGLDPWIFTKKYYKSRNRYFYLDFSFLETVKYLIEHDKNALAKRYSSLLTYFNNASKFPAPESVIAIPPDDFGSVTLKKTAVNFDCPEDYYQIASYGWSALQFNYLKKIQDYCIHNNINFSMFIPPKRSDYSAYYKIYMEKDHNDYLENMIQSGISAQIFGKFDQLELMGDSVFFSEAYHLNGKGQNKYSEIFYEMTLLANEQFSKKYDWFKN